MNLEEYKNRILEALEKQVGKQNVDHYLNLYKEELPMFLKENWTPEGSATAMINGY